MTAGVPEGESPDCIEKIEPAEETVATEPTEQAEATEETEPTEETKVTEATEETKATEKTEPTEETRATEEAKPARRYLGTGEFAGCRLFCEGWICSCRVTDEGSTLARQCNRQASASTFRDEELIEFDVYAIS